MCMQVHACGANSTFTRLKNIKIVKGCRDGMPKACKQGRDDIIVKVNLQSLIPASFSLCKKM